MRVFLIGFMCSGKTRIGRALAPLMGLQWADVDRVIEQRIGPITPWVLREGEAAFRAVEREVLLELLEQDGLVVSCGGGTPMSADNMERMRAAGTVVYLDVPLDVLIDRCARVGRDRPLLFGLDDAALCARIKGLLAERLPTYRRAHLHVQAADDPTAIAERIAERLKVQDR
ncbi:MAG: shikimate kinase [Flavobacteriales bacterium]